MVALLALVLLFPVSGLAGTCEDYDVEYLGSQSIGGDTQFSYRVSSSAPPAVSHWVLELPDCISSDDVVDTNYDPWTFADPDPTTGITGIKFDDTQVEEESQVFTFTLQGAWPEQTSTAALKSGKLAPCYVTVTGPGCPAPELSISKTGTASVEIGGTVQYTIVVSNTGSVTLHDVTVSDPKLGLSETFSTLAVGASETIAATYGPVSGADLAEIVNTATADSAETGPVTASHTTTIDIVPGIAVSKASNHPAGQIGKKITYTYTVWNTGNAPLSLVALSDDILGPVSGPVSGDANSNGALDVTETWIYAADYIIDWEDRNSFADGSHYITNVVSASGTAPDNAAVTSVSEATIRICTVNLTVEKSAPSEAAAGGEIVYTIVVTNNGPMDKAVQVVLTDSLPSGLSDATYEIVSGGSGSGAWTGSIDLGDMVYPSTVTIEITATVDPSAPTSLVNQVCVDNNVLDPDDTDNCDSTTTTVLVPELTIDKTGPEIASIGGTIDYTITVTNTGDITLHGISVIDAKLGLSETIASLSVGDSQTYHGTYGPVTESDLPSVVNTAIADSDETDPIEDGHTTTVLTNPSLSLEKSGPATANIGDTVEYTITVTNTGDVSLHNVTLLDPMLSLNLSVDLLGVGEEIILTPTYGPIAEGDAPAIVNTATAEADEVDPVSDDHTLSVPTHPALSIAKTGPATAEIGDIIHYTITVTNTGDITLRNVTVTDAKLGINQSYATLAPGEDVTLQGSYGPVTENDAPAIPNTATAVADEVGPVSDDHTVTIETHPAMILAKSGPATAEIGDTVTYEIVITNTGDVTLHDVTMSDAKLGILNQPIGTLGVGESTILRPTYGPITEDDAPEIDNTATAHSEETDPVSDDHTVAVTTHPALAIAKSGPETAGIGEAINYAITVTNTGDVTLHNVTVVDPLLGLSETIASLAPGSDQVFYGTYGPVTEDDLPSVTNTAIAASNETGSEEAAHTTEILSHPSLAIDKTGPNTARIGETIDYSITVTNTGDVTLHNVAIVDTLLGLAENIPSLAPGGSQTVDGAYGPILEEDVPSVFNTAVAASDETNPVTDTHTVTISTHPALAIEKTGPETADIGEVVDYKITVTNTGDITLHNVSIVDELLGLNESLDTLAPGAAQEIYGSYGPVTEGDAPAVVNVATAVADEAGPVSDDHTVHVIAHPALSIEKTGPGTANIGEQIDYSITVTNTGDVTLHNVSIVDELLGLNETFASLAPGAAQTVDGRYGPVAEGDAPAIVNVATAKADEVGPVSADHTVSIMTHPALAIDKTGDASTTIGGTVDYTITVTNTGDVTLHNVRVIDEMLGIEETFAILAPGASQPINGSYGPVVEQDAPVIENTATADSDETEPVADSHSVPVNVNPSLAIDKTGDASATIGGTVNYTITVTNTGDITLHNVRVVDEMLGIDETLASLAPGAGFPVSGIYGPVVEDDAPMIENTATADSDETEPVTDSHSVPVNVNPSLAIDKSGDTSTAIGQTVDYTITVTNTGDITLHNVTIIDELLGLNESLDSLAPGAAQTVNGSYGPVVEGDAPVIENTATANSNETEPVADSHSVPVNVNPSLAINKTGDTSTAIGQTVDYTITVTNTGDITLHNVRVIDTMLGIDETVASLAPGAGFPVSGTYGPVVEQDAPVIENTATANSDETERVADSHSVPVNVNPGLAIDKTGDQGPARIGETVDYTITVTNTGDITLHNVRVVDELLGIDETVASLAPGAGFPVSGTYGPITEQDTPGPIVNTATASSDETAPISDSHSIGIESFPALALDKTGSPSTAIGQTVNYTLTVTNVGDITLHNVRVIDEMLGIDETFAILAPGASQPIIGSYGPVVEDDAPAIENTATADSDETEPVADSHSVPVSTNPALAIDKTGDASATIGGTVDYTITVTNTGDISLHNVRVIDAMLGIDETFAILAPGASQPINGTYGPVVEHDAPVIENTATAKSDETEPVFDSHSVPVNVNPSLAIDKTGDGSATIGGTVNYTITVTNTGDISLHNVRVVDEMLDVDETFAILAPGGSQPINGTYGPVVEHDAPVIENTATADSDETEPVADSHSVPVNLNPALAIDKTGDASAAIGGTVNFTITVTNTGDITLHNVRVVDAMLGIDETFASLAPGASQPINGTYGPVVEENAPVIENTATADSDETGPVADSHSVPVNVNPALAIDKTGDASATIGGTVDYTITVTNTGDITLHNVHVVDEMLGIDETFASLAPGASQPINGTYGPVVEEDTPMIENTATAASDETEPVTDSHSVPVNVNPGLTIEKTGDQGPAQIGDTVSYSLTVTNVGDITLHNIHVVDAMLGIDQTFASLAPGAWIPLSGTYGPVTEQDTPGPIVNTATADSDESGPVSDSHSIGIESFPALALDKTGDPSTAIGQTVNYTLTVTNVGDITLHNVVVTDAKLGISETFDSLAPGASIPVNGAYGPVTENDAPVIENTASADSDETGPVTDSHSVPVTVNPSLVIDKTGDLSTALGQTVDYTITVTNTGDITLHNVVVTDGKLGINQTFASLAPGVSQQVFGSYGPVIEEDTPVIVNTATATADEAGPVSDSHSVPVSASPELSIVKSGPSEATIGDSIDYTIAVTNTGDITLHNVVVTDAMLGVSETFSTIAPGATHQLSATYGPVLEEDVPSIVNTATAVADEAGPVSDSHTVQIAPALIDLSLTKTVSNPAPAPGEIIVFTITLANAPDAANATGVEVTDQLPSGYSFLASSPSQGGYNSATGLWRVGSLDAGASATLELTAIVQPTGEYTSPAEVTLADQEDIDSTPANADAVSEDDDDEVLVAIRLADLAVTKTVDNEEPGVGDTIEFTLTVTNLGPSDASGVSVSDSLPFGLSYVSDSGFGTYSPITDLWQIGTIADGESVSLTILARVEANAGSTLVNTAEIASSDLPDPNEGNNRDTASVDVIAADLRVTKTVDNAAPAEGEEIVFTIQVTNQGPNTATNVRLTDLLPDGLTYVSDDAPGTYLQASGLWTVALLPVGATDTLRIIAVPDAGTAGTTITNLAEVSARQVDPDPSDNSDTVDVEVQDNVAGGGGGLDECTGKVIINEVAWAGTSADADDEWIELRNVGGEPVDLTGWTLRWRKKEPVTPEDFEWRVVSLSGVLEGAAISACELAEQDPTPSVDFEKRQIDDVSWRVVSRPLDIDESYLLVERRTDKTVSTHNAEVVYDTVEPYTMELHNEGEIIELLDANGIVVDSANAFPMPTPAWPAGDAATYATMERTDPLGPDTPDNWHTNLGITTWGQDALGEPLVATADTVNSRPLEEMELFANLTPTKTLAGARLEVALELSRQERRATGWPWIRVTRPVPAGGGGESLVSASYSFASRYSNDLYWLGIDTAGLPPGNYLVWVVYGEGETVLVPISILP